MQNITIFESQPNEDSMKFSEFKKNVKDLYFLYDDIVCTYINGKVYDSSDGEIIQVDNDDIVELINIKIEYTKR